MKQCEWCPDIDSYTHVRVFREATHAQLQGCPECEDILERYLCDLHTNYAKTHPLSRCLRCDTSLEYLYGKLP